MRMPWFTLPLSALFAALLVLGGCTGTTGSTGEEDAGADVEDAGTEPEVGTPEVGTPEEDAGSEPEREPEVDAGGEPDPAPAEPDPSEPETPPSSLGASYFSSIDRTARDQALVLALQARLSETHDRVGFDSLWDAYEQTDTGRCGDGIFDVYSDRCWQPEEKCGQYSGEGQCFNREHLWPKSWWGGREGTDAHSDLFVVVPSDGYVNGRRANLAFGLVSDASYTSSNGSQLGRCQNPAVSANDCFAPAPQVRGDIARAFFYFAVRYEGEFTCCDEASITDGNINGWQERLLRQWHEEDPVDDAERARNEAVFTEQRNRNPFIDYPNLVHGISDF